MTTSASRTRRQILSLLVSTALTSTLGRAAAGPFDQGIGGTGAAPPTDESDRGIGGTGVIGTIRKFGSIVVNDLRISYPANADVRIDDRPASVSDLKIGQVVRVDAGGAGGALSTHTIDVASEVVGPVERASAKQITVLGQTVSTAGLKKRSFTVGETVAVSGLRRNDGTVVASLIERRDNAPSRVSGPVTSRQDGAPKIGNLDLVGLDSSLVGRRIVIAGQQEGNRFVVASAVPEAALLPNVRTLSVESYVERRGGKLTLGSGFAVGDTSRVDLPAGRSVRAVLTTTVGADGRLTVESVQANGRTYGDPAAARGGSGGEGSGGRGGSGSGTAPGKSGGSGGDAAPKNGGSGAAPDKAPAAPATPAAPTEQSHAPAEVTRPSALPSTGSGRGGKH